MQKKRFIYRLNVDLLKGAQTFFKFLFSRSTFGALNEFENKNLKKVCAPFKMSTFSPQINVFFGILFLQCLRSILVKKYEMFYRFLRWQLTFLSTPFFRQTHVFDHTHLFKEKSSNFQSLHIKYKLLSLILKKLWRFLTRFQSSMTVHSEGSETDTKTTIASH